MNELINIESSVQYMPAKVDFPDYEIIRQNALELADRIHKVEVTEENVTIVKKDLAQVRKIVTELNNRRKLVKAEILKDYNTFESQIKDIDSIITDAENAVRMQTRQIEEEARRRKHDAIREIWDKRAWQYTISMYGDFFEKWLQPVHLNKTTSMKSIEKDMTDWLEARQKDMDTLLGMDGEYFVEYIDCLDISEAITAVNHRREIRKAMKEDEEIEDVATFIITGKKNIKLVEMLLNENEIEYRRTK